MVRRGVTTALSRPSKRFLLPSYVLKGKPIINTNGAKCFNCIGAELYIKTMVTAVLIVDNMFSLRSLERRSVPQ